MGILDKLIPIQEKDSLQQILNNMIDIDNVAMKTQIQKPSNLTKLAILSKWIRSEQCPDTSDLLDIYITEYRINMVSYNRQSRKEVIAALTSGLQQERNIQEKLTEVQEKKK